MNADRLLAHFEKISEAPDAVDRLRTLVLSLAYGGKLLSSIDGPAKDWNQSTVAGVATEIAPGMACSKSHQTPKGHVHLRTHNVATNGRLNFDLVVRVDPKKLDLEKSGLRRGDVLFNNTNSQELVGKTCLVDQDYEYAFSNHLTRIRLQAEVSPEFFTRYFQLLLRQGVFAALCNRWIGQAGINTTALKGIAFSYPPLAEQRRIVEKVDELMLLCDRLEASQAERETRRDRLVVASLNRLGNPTGSDPDEFKKDAGFHLRNLHRLSTKPEHIKELRKAILNLAVRGKLVPQDQRDARPPKSLELCDDATTLGPDQRANTRYWTTEDDRYPIPPSWIWTRLGMIGEWGSGTTPSRGKSEYYGGTTSWFKSGELNDNQCLADSEERVTPLALKECSFRHNKPGDVLFAMYGATIGKLAILAEDAVTNQAVVACTPCAHVGNRYLFLFLLSQRQRFHMASEGGAQPNVSKAKVVRCPIPLPPLAEQKRIVAKVDELMAICDQLEKELISQQKESRRLLEALLHEALEGVG